MPTTPHLTQYTAWATLPIHGIYTEILRRELYKYADDALHPNNFMTPWFVL
jgi:hypothetical protein